MVQIQKKSVVCVSLVLIILTGGSDISSQTLINTTGNTIQGGVNIVEYTIGEIGTTTLSGNENYLSQGFLQPIIHLKDCNLLKLIPNAFTPNKDKLNDCFGVRNWPSISSYELSVYNRSGQLIFKTTSLSECWNGDFNGLAQPTGAYVYFLKAVTLRCGPITNKGTILLIR